jgi:hypothetical protein
MAIMTEDILWFSSVSPGMCRISALKVGHDHVLPYYFQIIIHLTPFDSVLYSLNYWKSVVK